MKRALILLALFSTLSSANCQNINMFTELGYTGGANMTQGIKYTGKFIHVSTGINSLISPRHGMFLSVPVKTGFVMNFGKGFTSHITGGYAAYVPTQRGLTNHSYIVETELIYKWASIKYQFIKMQHFQSPFLGVTFTVYAKSFNKRN